MMIWECDYSDADQAWLIHTPARPDGRYDIVYSCQTCDQALATMGSGELLSPAQWEWHCLALRNNSRGRVKAAIYKLQKVRTKKR